MADKTKSQNRKILSKLTINKLKELAKKYELKTAGCKKKNDYVNILLKSERVPDIMKDEEFFEKEVKDLEEIEKDLKEVGKDIEEAITKIIQLPKVVDEEADSLLIKRMNLDIAFDDVEDMLDQIRMRFEERNYAAALNQSMRAKQLTTKKLTDLERHLWTYSILSSQRIIEDCHRAGAKTKRAQRLLISAKDSYKDDDIIDNTDLLEDLQDEARELLDAEVKRTRKKLATREEFVNEIKNLGGMVTESEELLLRARETLERNDHTRALEYADGAREAAKGAKARRIQEIKDAIPLTRKVMDEAKQMDVDIADATKLLKQADVALKKKDYMLCSELTKRAEQKTYELQSTQTQKALELRQRQIQTIANTISTLEPIVYEAEGYRLNVGEARDLLNRARVALEAHDYVNGTLYTNNAQLIVEGLKPEIEKIKGELKGAKPQSGICSKCKSTYLQFYDNGWGKCVSCGNMFKWVPEKPVEDEEKGFFEKLFKK